MSDGFYLGIRNGAITTPMLEGMPRAPIYREVLTR
jgi:hypothetical protein